MVARISTTPCGACAPMPMPAPMCSTRLANRREQIVAVLEAVAPKPVNVLVGSPRLELSLDELEALGVKRVSLGSNLARVAFGAFHEAAQALARRDLEATRAAMPFDRINDLFR